MLMPDGEGRGSSEPEQEAAGGEEEVEEEEVCVIDRRPVELCAVV